MRPTVDTRCLRGSRTTVMCLVLLGGLAAKVGPAAAADLEDGKRIFEQTCAACHGAKGHPDRDSPIVKAFDPPPADLSDPLFNSREPALDWELVVKHGGHALGLSPQMPAWGEAFSDAEIASIVAHIKSLADTRSYPPGELNLMLPVRTKKAFPEDEIVWHSRYESLHGRDVWRNVLEIEWRIGSRGQGIVEFVHENAGPSSALEEIELGYKHALRWSLEKRYLLSGAVVVAAPTDSEASEEIIPYLALAKELNARSTLQASARAVLPTDDVNQGAFEFAGIVHWVWSDWPRRVFPALELTATVDFERGTSEAVQFTVLPQIRVGLTRGGHVALNLGTEVPLSDQPYDWRAHLTLLWDFADGALLQGW